MLGKKYCFRLHLSRHVRPYEFYNGLVVVAPVIRILREELGSLSMTERQIIWGIAHPQNGGIVYAEQILA